MLSCLGEVKLDTLSRCDCERLVITIPGYNSAIVQQFIKLLYLGSCTVGNNFEVELIYQLARSTGLSANFSLVHSDDQDLRDASNLIVEEEELADNVISSCYEEEDDNVQIVPFQSCISYSEFFTEVPNSPVKFMVNDYVKNVCSKRCSGGCDEVVKTWPREVVQEVR